MTSEEEVVPKDLGIKIVSKEVAAWTRLKEEAMSQNEVMARNIIVNQAVIDLCDSKIEYEENVEKLK